MSKIFRLNASDLTKGVVVAVLVAVLGVVQQALGQHGLDLGAYDWAMILDVAWKAGCAYLAKNFLSDEDGLVMGKIG